MSEVRSSHPMSGSRAGRTHWVGILLTLVLLGGGLLFAADSRKIQQKVLEDKIRGGFLGQLFGNLNGRPHEFKYIEEPGEIPSYVPDLSQGAVTDDDTDIEWVYLFYMQKDHLLKLPYARIEQIWKLHLNNWIWASNRFARSLMDLGVPPPLTGTIALNPYAEYNISGQFVSESFGLIAPGMPGMASDLGRHYLHVTVENEPIQALQLFTTMISEAFFEPDLDVLLERGLAATDPSSRVARLVRDVRAWHRENPTDWRLARRRLIENWTYAGSVRDLRTRNGYEINTACTLLALLYGNGDFAETLRLAFSLGWDADNTAATAGTILGVIRGLEWMESQGWKVKDIYQNTRRPGMPEDETISSYGDRLVDLARRNVVQNGGTLQEGSGGGTFSIPYAPSLWAEFLAPAESRRFQLREAWEDQLRQDLQGDPPDKARAAYMAVALGASRSLEMEFPDAWREAIEILKDRAHDLLKQVSTSGGPAGLELRARFRSEGLDTEKLGEEKP